LEQWEYLAKCLDMVQGSMGIKSDNPKCPRCGATLEDAGCYKWDCPNDCYPVALELGQMEI
jgi:hypothetical protein